MTNAWSLWRRVVPHAVLRWKVCKPCAVPLLSIPFSMNPSLSECWGWCHLSPVSRWPQNRCLHRSQLFQLPWELMRNDRHFWGTVHLILRLTAKVKRLRDSKQEEKHRADGLKWNRSKGGPGWGWRGRTWLSHDKMHKAPTGPLPAPVPYSWRELYKLSHTHLMNAPSYKPAAIFLPAFGLFFEGCFKGKLYVKEDDWNWFDLHQGSAPTVWKDCHLMAV